MRDARFCWQSLCFHLVWQHYGSWPERDIAQRLIERRRGDQVTRFMVDLAQERLQRGEHIDTQEWRPAA